MNATLTAERSYLATDATLRSSPWDGRWLATVQARVAQLSTRQRVVAGSIATAFVVAAAGIAAGPHLMGYLGVFVFSTLANAILFLPSGRGAVMVAGALVLNPMAVALLTGIGGAIGELTGYALGHSTRKVVKPGKVKVPGWLSRGAEGHMALTILAVSIIPNPFVDVIGVVVGRVGYPVKRFLAYSILGKVVQSIAFVYLALWNISLLSSWLGLGQ